MKPKFTRINYINIVVVVVFVIVNVDNCVLLFSDLCCLRNIECQRDATTLKKIK